MGSGMGSGSYISASKEKFRCGGLSLVESGLATYLVGRISGRVEVCINVVDGMDLLESFWARWGSLLPFSSQNPSYIEEQTFEACMWILCPFLTPIAYYDVAQTLRAWRLPYCDQLLPALSRLDLSLRLHYNILQTIALPVWSL